MDSNNTPTISLVQDASGFAVPAVQDLKDSDIITLDGLAAPVGDLIRLGVLSRQPDGRMATPPPAAPEKQAAQEVDPSPKLDPRAETILSAVADFGGGLERAAVLKEAFAGDISDASISNLASRLELEPAAARKLIEFAHGELTRQAASVVAQEVPQELAEEALQWLKDQGKLEEAVSQQINTRSAKAYQGLGLYFMAELDRLHPDVVEAALPEDMQAGRTSDGSILVRIDGAQMPWSSAVRAGLITLKRK